MKRLLLAATLLLPLAAARAQQDDAYESLVSMADSAAADKGPDAGEIGADLAEERLESAPPEAAKTESEAQPAARTEAASDAPAPPAAPKRERVSTRQDESAPVVSAPPPAPPRVWTAMFSALIPSTARIPAFEVSLSTAARRGPSERARPATVASAAGAAQGLIELVSAATTPAAPQASPDR